MLFASSAYGQCLITPPVGFPETDIAFQTGLTAASANAKAARIALGKQLFSDTRLSLSGRHSCASCHDPKRHFADGQPRSRGATGLPLPFNAPTLFNAGLRYAFGWQSGGPDRLSEQHRQPLTNTDPIELGFGPEQLDALNADRTLRAKLAEAAIQQTTAERAPRFTLALITRLIAGYVADLRCATAFDRYTMKGVQDALSEEARRGLALFTEPALGCSACHSGPLLGGGLRARRHAFAPVAQERRRGATVHVLNTPSLRGVAHTAPYFFDGSAPDLETVLDQYAQGTPVDLPAFTLTSTERRALMAFLATL